ncbi:fumarylacetoacetate hydrolase family protein [Candidatus Pelagibacter sp. Uisw_127]|uniref:fumarylacetoacetate hydrolase family protein n=1 Tax=Candidatus Pelagibacter sp. Uisw_127 TaxID=3230988 RepID=UPI0039E89181
MKFIKTIIGNLDKKSISKIKTKKWNGYVMPIKDNIFQKLDKFKLEKVDKKKFIKLKKKDFLIPIEINSIIGVGKNYTENYSQKLIKQFNKSPDFFMMNKNSLIASNKKTFLNKCYKSILVEGEIGVVIKKKCKNIKQDKAKNYILGYLICNDYSGRDLMSLKKDSILLRKSLDGFLPIGPAIKLGHQKNDFIIKTIVNKKLIQSFDTQNLILNIEQIISNLSQYVTLNKNDLICTGSAIPKPKVKRGDNIRITVDGLGMLNSNII